MRQLRKIGRTHFSPADIRIGIGRFYATRPPNYTTEKPEEPSSETSKTPRNLYEPALLESASRFSWDRCIVALRHQELLHRERRFRSATGRVTFTRRPRLHHHDDDGLRWCVGISNGFDCRNWAGMCLYRVFLIVQRS